MAVKVSKKTKEMDRLFNEMAIAKTWIKNLEKEYDENSKKAWDLLKGKTFQHEDGTFTKQTREFYGVLDKCALVKEMTFKVYKEHSTISKTGIIKAIGEKGFNSMEEKGVVAVSSTSEFFVFKKKKEKV